MSELLSKVLDQIGRDSGSAFGWALFTLLVLGGLSALVWDLVVGLPSKWMKHRQVMKHGYPPPSLCKCDKEESEDDDDDV